MKNPRYVLLAGAIVLLMANATMAARAAERVFLRTGSNLICDHRHDVGGQTRLYLTASGNNYVEVASSDIVRTETVPASELPPPAAAASDSTAAPAPARDAARPNVNLPVLLDRAGAAHDLDPDLLASVVHAESGGHPRAVSDAGAQGLMQLMPATAADLGVRNSFQPQQNIAGGTTYLDALLRYYHENLALALAAYNAGPRAVNRYGGIPPYAETRRYVARVIHDYNRRKRQEARQHRMQIARDATPAATATQAMDQP